MSATQLAILDDPFQSDFEYTDSGSIILLFPRTPAAHDWVSEHIPSDAQWFGNGIVIEHRYFDDIALGISMDGLRIE